MKINANIAVPAFGAESSARAAGHQNLRLLKKQPIELPDPATARVAVVGLGYVGLPLVCGFSTASRSIGLDIDEDKIQELKSNFDRTGEVNGTDLAQADAEFSSDPAVIAEADVILICVLTVLDAIGYVVELIHKSDSFLTIEGSFTWPQYFSTPSLR